MDRCGGVKRAGVIWRSLVRLSVDRSLGSQRGVNAFNRDECLISEL